jgi:OFA family oxalate/formate antiporter-like MFS transporter
LRKNHQGWIVVCAGLGMNLAFGVLYSWSIFSKSLVDTYGWTQTQASMPYTVAIIMLALIMTPAGKLQDKYGARLVASFGGAFTGIGMFLSSYINTPSGLMFSFGVLGGTGIALGYASATPVALKWFPANKKGVVSGMVIAGFGLSPVYIAPLANYLIRNMGLNTSFRILGIAFLIIVIGMAQGLKKPKVENNYDNTNLSTETEINYSWRYMLKTKEFYQFWIMLLAGSLGGLMIIGQMSKIATIQSGQNLGYILLALTAISNAAGRPISGFVSDKIGRFRTLILLFICESITFANFSKFDNFYMILFGAAIITFTYGSMFSIMPSTISDYYGKKNLGLNYGILFSAWGIGGVIGPILASNMVDIYGNFNNSYLLASGLCAIGALIAFTIKPLSNKFTTEI